VKLIPPGITENKDRYGSHNIYSCYSQLEASRDANVKLESMCEKKNVENLHLTELFCKLCSGRLDSWLAFKKLLSLHFSIAWSSIFNRFEEKDF